MQVEIWSDIACPWCLVGKRRLEAALERFEHADEVEVHWRSFELAPDAPALQEGDYVTRLADKYGTDDRQAREMIERMRSTAAEEGLAFDFEHIRPGNTFDAHRLIHLAGEHGKQDTVKERLLTGYLEEGAAIGDHAELKRLAVEAGLPGEEVAAVLGSDRYAEAVRADEQRARRIGVDAVPFFAIDERFGVPGAQPADVMLEVLQRTWEQGRELTVVGQAPGGGEHGGHDHAPGEACADGSCAI